MLRCSVLWGILIAAAHALAQETIHHASLSGKVADPSGAVVSNALVTARHLDTNLASTATTDLEGRFRFAYLRGGRYGLTVQRAGFAESVRTLELNAGGAYNVEISLTISNAETTVTVDSEAEVLEAARSQVASTVTEAEIDDLPLNGRNFLDIALLAPGVSPANTGSNQLFAETSAVPGQGISVSSQRNFSNNFLVDGLSANDDASGLSGVFYGADSIQQFQVVTNGAQAELGRALGGYINVVTKSGTNALHGDLYGYFRNQRFNAANPLSREKLPMTQAQYGASVGGPLLRDRTFYFGNLEQRNLNQSGLITVTPENAALINQRLDTTGYQGSRLSTGIYPNPVHLMSLLAKLDHQFTARDLLTLRYSLYDSSSNNSRGAGGLSTASASAGLDNRDQTIAAGNILTLSPRTVNETRGQFTNSGLSALPTDPAGPAVVIAGVAAFGRLSSSPTGRLNRLYEAVDNLSHQTGAHAVRAGINFLYNDNSITFPRSLRGSYSFASLSSFLAGTYNNSGYTQTFGNTVAPQGNPNLGLYAQDEWKIARSLTLNFGLRYDLQFLRTIQTDLNNISPRAGFAWSPFRSRRTVVRGGFGLYYDRVPLRALANALLSSGNTTNLTELSQVSVSLSPNQTGAPVFPNTLASLPPGVLVNFSTMDRQLQNAYSQQASIEIEHQAGSKTTVSLGYQRVRGLHLLASINQNPPSCVAAGNNNGCRPNPNYANSNLYSAAGDSYYDGLHFSLHQRPAKWGSYRVSYTYSKSMNNVGEFFFSSPIDPYNIWKDYGRSDEDQRHRVVFFGSLQAPVRQAAHFWDRIAQGFQLSGMLQYYSALPLNITTGATTVQGTSARPLVNGEFLPRNAGTGPAFLGVNLRTGRTFQVTDRLRLEALAEAFNVLNRRNDLTLNGVFGTAAYPSSPAPAFGRVTSVQDPRALQFALRFSF